MEGIYDVLIAEYGSCPQDCVACEIACADKRGNGLEGRMKSLHLPEVGFHGVVKCNQCSKPSCSEVCPTAAIIKGEDDGVVRILEERCVGCGLCTLACPYGGIYYNSQDNRCIKCDNCDGHPECVDACKYTVLRFAQSRPVYNYLHEDLVTQGVSTCAGCGVEISERFALRVLGRDVIVFGGPGCSCAPHHAMPFGRSLRVPNCLCFMTNVPSIMTGVKRYMTRIGKDVTCVAFCGDGLTADVGFQPLSGAAERGENLLYICMDNEAYMNTGIQRSSTTPFLSWTTTTPVGQIGKGKQQEPKNVPLLMAFHGIPYVATATIAFPEDFARKLIKAKAVKDGMAYIHVLSPCPTGWRSPVESTIELSRMAVETNYFPLWEAERVKFRLTYRPKRPRPFAELAKMMGKFSHLSSQQLNECQKVVDSKFNIIKSLAAMEREQLSPGVKAEATGERLI